MHILLFILYSLICGYGIVRLPFIRRSGIKPVVLLLLFSLHVGTGCLHNVIAYKYFPGHGDVWSYFTRSFSLRHQLLTQMLTDFHTFITGWTWSVFTHENLLFIHIALNCLSFDNLYINTLLLSFPVFLGNIALFRVFRRRFPNDPLTAATIFLLPSVLFWTSCIHREALLYMSVGFLLSGIDRPHSKKLYLCLLWLAIIAFFRGAFALTLLPALFIWLWLEKPAARRTLQWIAAAAITAIVLVNLLVPSLTVPALLAAKQHEFTVLEGHSRIFLPPLDGSWQSVLQSLAYFLFNGLFVPLPGQGGQTIYLAFALELLAIWAIAVIALAGQATRQELDRPFAIFCLVLALGGALEIGATIPFVGAIVRYRSIYLPFLLAPFLHAIRSVPPLRSVNQWLTDHAITNNE